MWSKVLLLAAIGQAVHSQTADVNMCRAHASSLSTAVVSVSEWCDEIRRTWIGRVVKMHHCYYVFIDDDGKHYELEQYPADTLEGPSAPAGAATVLCKPFVKSDRKFIGTSEGKKLRVGSSHAAKAGVTVGSVLEDAQDFLDSYPQYDSPMPWGRDPAAKDCLDFTTVMFSKSVEGVHLRQDKQAVDGVDELVFPDGHVQKRFQDPSLTNFLEELFKFDFSMSNVLLWNGELQTDAERQAGYQATFTLIAGLGNWKAKALKGPDERRRYARTFGVASILAAWKIRALNSHEQQAKMCADQPQYHHSCLSYTLEEDRLHADADQLERDVALLMHQTS